MLKIKPERARKGRLAVKKTRFKGKPECKALGMMPNTQGKTGLT